jgi:preprotein translocase subunit Sec61beta
MAEKKMRAPPGMAGLVRYEETEESLIKLKPEHVIAMCIGLMVLVFILFLLLP